MAMCADGEEAIRSIYIQRFIRSGLSNMTDCLVMTNYHIQY